MTEQQKGERLAIARKFFKYKQQEFADEFGYSSVQALSHVENGVRGLSGKVALKLVTELGISMNWIMIGKEPMIGDSDKANEVLARRGLELVRRGETNSESDEKAAIIEEMEYLEKRMSDLKKRIMRL